MKANCIFAVLFMVLSGAGCRHSTSEKSGKTIVAGDTAISTEKKKNAATQWIPNAKSSSVRFTIKNFGTDVHGTLEGLKAMIYFDEKDLEHSSFEGSVKVNTINTGINRRDKDLMQDKYLAENTNPDIIFRSGKILKSGNGYIAKGTLTIKGRQQPQEWPFTFERAGKGGIFRSAFALNRMAFGIGGNGPVMGKQIQVNLEVPVSKAD